MGIRGFSGNKSLLYHLRPPTAVQPDRARLRSRRYPTPIRVPCGTACSGPRICARGGDAVQGRVAADGQPATSALASRALRADGLLVPLRARRRSDFRPRGDRRARKPVRHARATGPGDYLVIPTGVIWRISPTAGVDQRMLVVETVGGHIEPPRRYLNTYGQFLESAPYSERDIRPPDRLVTHDERGEFEVRVKARGPVTRYIYDHHPARRGRLGRPPWPFAFNIDDFEPITGRVHQPPPVHQTFEGPGFVLCSFVPRLFDYHPLAIPAPYNHSNVDSDEVIYYVDGDFMSRRGIERRRSPSTRTASRTARIPAPTKDRSARRATEELAVMVDTFRPLQLTTHARRRSHSKTKAGIQQAVVKRPEDPMAEKNFEAFKETIEQQFMQHPVVTTTRTPPGSARGEMSLDELRHFTVQFSVFSNQFLLAALNRAINADTLQSARESKEILMNELGVIYNDGRQRRPASRGDATTDARATRRSCRPRARSTAAPSASRRRTSSGCCASASRWA